MRSRLDSAHKSVDISSARSNSLNKSESVGGVGSVVRSDSTFTGTEESPRRLMGLKWNQGGIYLGFNCVIFNKLFWDLVYLSTLPIMPLI